MANEKVKIETLFL